MSTTTPATGVPQQTVKDWVTDFSKLGIFGQPPSATTANPWGKGGEVP